MSRITAPVHLVGSLPRDTREEAMAICADRMGATTHALPDGEPGYRSNWVNYQAHRVFHRHPDLETVNRPQPRDNVDQWRADGLEELWNFRVKDGVSWLRFDDLHYADEADQSYRAFLDLRDRGLVPDGVRFQVSLPTAPGATMMFFRDDTRHYDLAVSAYQRALDKEVERLLLAVPADDLALQWDISLETLDLEGAIPWSRPENAWNSWVESVRRSSAVVPPEATMGYHLCWGDLGNRHLKEPADLALAVRMANAAVHESPRPIDWFHMPVPNDRDDDAYFAPLADADLPDSLLFLGLLHLSDGTDGATRRLRGATKYLPDGGFGVSTECGMGRRPAESLDSWLQLHLEVAKTLR
jgi:hypothetical protein